MKELGEKNYAIIAAGSVDGVCTAAAMLRILSMRGHCGIQVLFTQAFTVDKLDTSGIKPASHIILVDLAVNNRDEDMTFIFVNNLINAGHQLHSVIDEHDADSWSRIFLRACIDTDYLVFKPVSGKNTDLNSSGALLLNSLKSHDDPHVVELCKAADAGDRMDFTPRFASMVNQAVKSRIGDDARRKYLVHHLASGSQTPDDIIAGWISEYDDILRTHEEIKKSLTQIADGIIRIDTMGKIIDMTTLFNDLYKSGAKIVVMVCEAFNLSKGGKIPQVSIATCDRSLDLLTIIKQDVPSASGIANKANVDPIFENKAIAAVLKCISVDVTV